MPFYRDYIYPHLVDRLGDPPPIGDIRRQLMPLAQGSRVMLLWGAANRDGDEFPNPDAIDLARRNARAHLAFGLGIHHCIGAVLARLETRVVLETLLARTSALRLADRKVTHVPSLLVRSLVSLPVDLAT